MTTKLHTIRVHPSRDNLPKEEPLAWKIAVAATDDASMGLIAPQERERFLGVAQRLPHLSAEEVVTLNVVVTDLLHAERDSRGIF